MLVINSQLFNDYFRMCRPPLFELLLLIRHKSANHAFHIWYQLDKTKVQLKIFIEGFVHAHVYQVSIWGNNDVGC